MVDTIRLFHHAAGRSSRTLTLSLALAYFDHADVDVDAGVRRGMIKRLSDAEDGPKHQEPGLRH